MIQYVNTAIDTIQSIKTSFINSFITQESYKKPMLAFVDAQTDFAKATAKSVHDVAFKMGEDFTKFDTLKAFASK